MVNSLSGCPVAGPNPGNYYADDLVEDAPEAIKAQMIRAALSHIVAKKPKRMIWGDDENALYKSKYTCERAFARLYWNEIIDSGV